MHAATMLDREGTADELSFGEALRARRRDQKLTQEELAEYASVSPRTISGLERGEGGAPRRDTLNLLVQALRLAGAEREQFERLASRRRRPRQFPPARPRVLPRPAAKTPPNPARELTSFIGRDRELRELGGVLATAPLLTLVGAGGVGKSRLAQELARERADDFADGVWLVDLSEVGDPALVVCAVATALGLRDVCGKNGLEAVTEHLAPKQLLLIFDNCEHLVAACAAVVAHLLRRCPTLSVLVTSRESLAIQGETVWQLQPLAVPDPHQRQSMDDLAHIPAVRLFVDRARAVDRSFALNDDNAAAVVRICVAADGLPLALELAAASSHVLTVQQLAARLDHDIDALSVHSRSGAARHQTMRSSIGWSYRLLSERQRTLLSRLAQFPAGCTLETAERVCAGDGLERSEILHLLAHLVDKSMVYVTADHQVSRYRLLEAVRQYALQRGAAGHHEARSLRAVAS